MSNNLFKRSVEEVFSEFNKNDLPSKLNTLIFILKKGNIDELTEIMDSVDKDLIVNKILEIDKETLKNKSININISELRRRLTESDLDKIRQISGPRGDAVVSKLKQLLSW